MSNGSDSDSDGSGSGSGGGGGAKRTQKLTRKFRRPKATPEQRQAQRAADEERSARDAAFRGKSLALRGLYGTKGTQNPPCLLVDGYNVAHAWVEEALNPASSASSATGSRSLSAEERLRRLRAAQSLDGARQALLLDLCEFSQVAKVKVVVAFDAMRNPNCNGLVAARVAGVDVVYCGDRDADAFLMAEARRLSSSSSNPSSNSSSNPSSSSPSSSSPSSSARCSRVIVASSDREVQLGVDASAGCGFIGSELLLKEMRRAAKVSDAEYRVAAARELAAAGGLSRSLRSEAASGLRALKEGLLEAADEEKKMKKVSKKNLKQ